jgi:hypothetical protein
MEVRNAVDIILDNTVILRHNILNLLLLSFELSIQLLNSLRIAFHLLSTILLKLDLRPTVLIDPLCAPPNHRLHIFD